ncbi:MAG: PQQ-binding-like beta-propeller repeat protein [Gemmatimonadota bacterium]
MISQRGRFIQGALALTATLGACIPALRRTRPTDATWRVTGGDAWNSRYSTLDQINRDNVASLGVAWTYHTGEGTSGGQIQATPVVVHDVLYSTTGAGRAFAIDAATGKELWRFDPYAGRRPEVSANRGVVYWESGDDRRILFTAASRLYALDAATGLPKSGFGMGGWIDLAKGLGRDGAGQSVVATSPGMIYGDILIQGTRVGEADGAAPGHVRAFDVRTGAVRWIFHTIPQPGEAGYESWPTDAWRTVGGANSWAGMALDAARGVVYVPTGSATPDFYGGARVGANLFANSLLALDASTGRRLWHFQTVHHDILDRDLAAAPNLLTVVHDGKRIDAVAQIAKSGLVFLFDRVTGAPLFPIEERAVPATDVPGEVSWSTQPFPVKPAPFARQRISEADLTDISPEANAAVRARLRTLRNDGPFTPPSLRGSVVFPGFDGGGEWGGAAADLETGVLYVNASDVPWIAALVPVAVASAGGNTPRSGAAVFAAACASCHGVDRRGDGDRVSSLLDVRARLSALQIRDVIVRGRGFMPGFATLPAAERDAVTDYLLGVQSTAARSGPDTIPVVARAPFRLRGYERWKDPSGNPAVRPPWGTLNAIDLNTGDYLWKIPLGSMPGIVRDGMAPTGTEQYGGPVVTRGGLVFIAATQDGKFRAFDNRTGTRLWETTLPAAGYATPATYMVAGRQYVVVAAGGGKLGTPVSDSYVAFALP